MEVHQHTHTPRNKFTHYSWEFLMLFLAEIMCRGGSIIVSLGKVIAGPLYDKADALIEELDLNEIAFSKLDFDAVGHYSRDDIFEFKVLDQPGIKKE